MRWLSAVLPLLLPPCCNAATAPAAPALPPLLLALLEARGLPEGSRGLFGGKVPESWRVLHSAPAANTQRGLKVCII